jgi:hypothetical protein
METENLLFFLVILRYHYYYFTAIGRSPGGSRSYTDTDKERLYIKGTIQNKVHTISKASVYVGLVRRVKILQLLMFLSMW